MGTHEKWLRELIAFEVPVAEARAALNELGWDPDGVVVVVTRGDLRTVLAKYVVGDLGEGHLREWADAIEGREDIAYDQDGGSHIAEMIFELANPEITREPSRDRAREWIERLAA